MGADFLVQYQREALGRIEDVAGERSLFQPARLSLGGASLDPQRSDSQDRLGDKGQRS